MVNVLDPPRFWHGHGDGAKGHVGGDHKGGVRFTYCTSNPWRGDSSFDVPAPSVQATVAPAKPAPTSVPQPSSGTSDFGGGGNNIHEEYD